MSSNMLVDDLILPSPDLEMPPYQAPFANAPITYPTYPPLTVPMPTIQVPNPAFGLSRINVHLDSTDTSNDSPYRGKAPTASESNSHFIGPIPLVDLNLPEHDHFPSDLANHSSESDIFANLETLEQFQTLEAQVIDFTTSQNPLALGEYSSFLPLEESSNIPILDKLHSVKSHVPEECLYLICEDTGLVDIPFNGVPFTWSNNNNKGNLIKQRLDRELITNTF
ncbi:hypothetical protein GIB67_023746 [Kingdonia uniflora]|uniref:Uncharacterized protein n=1 Tax=Kingdonia uniflora TaxID=39325 RepID=A0A7J7LNJ7_9MAGN|nr:hypothetical protein GIB67_023746 [Kingdonia uniflora]